MVVALTRVALPVVPGGGRAVPCGCTSASRGAASNEPRARRPLRPRCASSSNPTARARHVGSSIRSGCAHLSILFPSLPPAGFTTEWRCATARDGDRLAIDRFRFQESGAQPAAGISLAACGAAAVLRLDPRLFSAGGLHHYDAMMV